MEEAQERINGFMVNHNCVMTSRPLKSFSYGDEPIKSAPALNFDTKLTLNAKNFLSVVDASKKLGESITLNTTTEQNKLNVSLKNGVFDLSLDLPLVNVEGTTIKETRSIYSLEFISSFLKEFKQSELKNKDVQLEFSTEYPLKITLGDVWAVIAPRVSNE